MIALALLGTGSPTASASGVGQVLIEPKTERPSSMSRESVMIELFNRWESKFGTTANLTWSQPASRIPTSPMTQKAIVRSHETPIPQRSLISIKIARAFAWLCTITHSQATALGFALRLSGQMRKLARHIPRLVFRSTELQMANSQRPGLASCRLARSGRMLWRNRIGQVLRLANSSIRRE